MKVNLKVQGISCAMCAKAIETALKRLEGIKKLSISLSGTVSVDFDESKTSINKIVAAIEKIGYSVLKEWRELNIIIDGMSCFMCVKKIENALNSLKGILDKEVVVGRAKIVYDPNIIKKEDIIEVIKKLGYNSILEKEKDFEIEEEMRKKKLKEVEKKLLISLIFSLTLIFITIIGENFSLLKFAIATAAIAYGREIFLKTMNSLKNKAPTMESMYALGITSAYISSILSTFGILSEEFKLYETSVFLMFFLFLGKYIDERTRAKMSDALKKLLALQPKKARVLRNGKEAEVAVQEIHKEEIVLVRPGEAIPVDGIVVEGESFVDESTIDGEPVPKLKKIGDRVFSGTINLNSILKIKAEKVGKETLVGQIIKIVEEAQFSKPRIQKLADKIVSIFVPLVLTVAISSFVYWFITANFLIALTALLSVLVIACPCTFGIATPIAISLGVRKAAEVGVLIKNSDSLEKLKKSTFFLFDKTGTITEGSPEVSEIFCFGFDEKEVLSLSASAEKNSNHPIAKAILKRAKESNVEIGEVESFEEISGMGVKAKVKGKKVVLGKEEFVEREGVSISEEFKELMRKMKENGRSFVIVAIDNKAAALIGIADIIRSDAFEVVKKIKKKKKVGIVTGDSKIVANAVAKELGLNFVEAEVDPIKKAEIVENLQKNGEIVVFVGDGINDAPALAKADVGIAVGSARDVAMEAGDVVLIRKDLKSLVFTLKLAEKVFEKVKQNLFWAMIYNILLIPMASGLSYAFFNFFFRPEFAASAMILSSLSVTANSLLLKKLNFERV